MSVWLPSLALLLGQAFQVSSEVSEVEFGHAFPLTVVREWPRNEEPPPFDVSLLDPLVVEAGTRSLEEDQGQVRETLRFQARVFLLEDYRLEGTPFRVRVLPSLDRNAPGPVEAPGPLLEIPGGIPWPVQVLGALLFLTAVLLGLRVLRSPGPPPAGEVGEWTPWERARQQLAALRARPPSEPGHWHPAGDELSDVVRQLLVDGLSLPAWERTSTEILALADLDRRCHQQAQGPLVDLLTRCDRLRFSAPPGLAEDWSQALDGLAAFLAEAQPRTPPVAPHAGSAGSPP